MITSKQIIVILATIICQVGANSSLFFEPPAQATNSTPVAVVWIHRKEVKPAAYKTIVAQFQTEAAAQGLQAYVAVPDFEFGYKELKAIKN